MAPVLSKAPYKYLHWPATLTYVLPSASSCRPVACIDSTLRRRRAAKHRQHLDGPPMDGCVIDLDAPFGHHLLKLPQTQPIGYVPVSTRQDDSNVERSRMKTRRRTSFIVFWSDCIDQAQSPHHRATRLLIRTRHLCEINDQVSSAANQFHALPL